MFSATAALAVAYRATGYTVRWRGREVVLRIGALPPPLPWGACRQAAFVTACNPCGRPMPVAWNRRAGRRMVAALRRAGWRFLSGQGRGDAGDWPPEPSVLVFGMNRSAAAALGRRWRQNAVLRVASSGAVALVPLR